MCEARQHSDQKFCKRCALTWDMNDPDPPRCLTAKEVGDLWIEKMRTNLEKRSEK